MGKIIVVEDNLVFSGYVCGMLESKGYRCLLYTSPSPRD